MTNEGTETQYEQHNEDLRDIDGIEVIVKKYVSEQLRNITFLQGGYNLTCHTVFINSFINIHRS